MRICIVVEGCYPYVVGGVSSWVQSLITSFPDYEFVIFSIGDLEEKRGRFVYTIPSNVIEIKEIFLDSVLTQETPEKFSKLNKRLKKELEKLISGEGHDWTSIFDYFRTRNTDIADFVMSPDFFDIIKRLYTHKYSNTKFIDFVWTMRSMYLTLFYVLRQEIPKADIYHTIATGYAGMAACMGKATYNKPIILSEHGIYTREREEEIIKATWVQGYFKELWIDYFSALSKCVYEYADKVTSLFQGAADIQFELGCKREKQMVTPNGIMIKDYENIPTKPKDDMNINIGAILRVTPIKDVKTLIQSFHIVKKAVSNAKLYLMGPQNEDPEYAKECETLIEFLGTKDVVFTGMINVKDYIGKMDICVLSSISEGMPLAVLEAMAVKKPFVATNVGSCKELIYGNNDGFGPCGYVVPVMNPTKLAQSLIELCQDEDLRKNMGQAGFNRVMESYTFEQFLENYRTLYFQLTQ